jgi:hypothetical protein
MSLSRQQAIVIGASVGVCAQRALSESWNVRRWTTVTSCLLGQVARRVVSQGRQLHVLLARGREALDKPFSE